MDQMQIICTSLQTDNHDSNSSLNCYRPDALHDAQSTVSMHKGKNLTIIVSHYGGNKYGEYDFAFIAAVAGINNFPLQREYFSSHKCRGPQHCSHGVVVCSTLCRQ